MNKYQRLEIYPSKQNYTESQTISVVNISVLPEPRRVSTKLENTFKDFVSLKISRETHSSTWKSSCSIFLHDQTEGQRATQESLTGVMFVYFAL